MWWKFTEDGEHVLYQLDEQTGHIAPIDTVDVVGAATPESVAKGGIFAQFAGVVWIKLPSTLAALYTFQPPNVFAPAAGLWLRKAWKEQLSTRRRVG